MQMKVSPQYQMKAVMSGGQFREALSVNFTSYKLDLRSLQMILGESFSDSQRGFA